MAEGKKSFILYADLKNTVEHLSDQKAGVLLKTILSYVNDENPEVTDVLVKIAFEPVKQQLKRDLGHWESIKVKRSNAGKISAEIKKAKSTNSTHVKSVEHNSTNSTVNDNVNVTVNVNDTVIKDVCSSGDKSPIHPKELFSVEQKESFKKFNEWIKKNTPRVAAMKEPFTIQQYISLVEKGYNSDKIRELLADMHNWADLHKKRVSAYLTLINWQRRENGRK